MQFEYPFFLFASINLRFVLNLGSSFAVNIHRCVFGSREEAVLYTEMMDRTERGT